MFETTFPDHSTAQDAPEHAGDALRAFDWSELVARIAATSDLRRAVGSSRRAGGFASFHAGTANHENSKQHGNPDGLGDEKHAACNGVGTNCFTRDGDREDR